MLTKADFQSDQSVRWCPGCGDYAILAQMQKLLPKLGIARENTVFVSGIGCASRFPYYMNTYGFHTIHGRAPAIATGLKVTRPELSVWVVTGDGDGLSIGGNHLIHAIRRNMDINILLFNNQIYGLTKGQSSPTSEFGKRTKSSPMGTIEQPVNAICVAIAAEGTFLARCVDTDSVHLSTILEKAASHKGTSFVEILQNCKVFNDNAFGAYTGKDVRDDNMLFLEHGEPMIFGKDKDKGIMLDGLNPKVVSLGNGVSESDLLVHDEACLEPSLAYFLSRMRHPDFPVPVGVFRSVTKPTYEALLEDQISQARQEKGDGDLDALLRSGDTWSVE